MTTPGDFPRLAVGSHAIGSGKGCIMNVISHWNGDKKITDMPACTHPVLARVAQILNDTICTHCNGELLCVDCSTIMFGYEPLLVGTSEPANPKEAKRLAVTMAVATRSIVEPLWRSEDRGVCAAAFDAAQGWLDGVGAYAVTDAAANAADAAANAADAAANAAYADAAANAAYAAAYADAAAYAANAAYAAAYAAYAANAAYAATNAVYAAAYAARSVAEANRVVLDLMINVYYQFTEKPRPDATVEHWAKVRTVLESAGIA